MALRLYVVPTMVHALTWARIFGMWWCWNRKTQILNQNEIDLRSYDNAADIAGQTNGRSLSGSQFQIGRDVNVSQAIPLTATSRYMIGLKQRERAKLQMLSLRRWYSRISLYWYVHLINFYVATNIVNKCITGVKECRKMSLLINAWNLLGS